MTYRVDAHSLPLRGGLPARSPASRDEGRGEGRVRGIKIFLKLTELCKIMSRGFDHG
jgi:hypothetical protein